MSKKKDGKKNGKGGKTGNNNGGGGQNSKDMRALNERSLLAKKRKKIVVAQARGSRPHYLLDAEKNVEWAVLTLAAREREATALFAVRLGKLPQSERTPERLQALREAVNEETTVVRMTKVLHKARIALGEARKGIVPVKPVAAPVQLVAKPTVAEATSVSETSACMSGNAEPEYVVRARGQHAWATKTLAARQAEADELYQARIQAVPEEKRTPTWLAKRRREFDDLRTVPKMTRILEIATNDLERAIARYEAEKAAAAPKVEVVTPNPETTIEADDNAVDFDAYQQPQTTSEESHAV